MAQLHTTYELIAQHASGRRLLIVYANRKTTRHMLELVRERYATIATATDTQLDRVTDIRGGAYPSCVYGEWTIRYSGRTRLQAKQEGELLTVAEVSRDPDAIVIEADAATLAIA